MHSVFETYGTHAETSVVVLACAGNEGGLRTFDGIVPGGLRVAREVRQFSSRLPSLETISFVGNSLGGLYTRQALGLLYDDGAETICGLRPVACNERLCYMCCHWKHGPIVVANLVLSSLNNRIHRNI